LQKTGQQPSFQQVAPAGTYLTVLQLHHVLLWLGSSRILALCHGLEGRLEHALEVCAVHAAADNRMGLRSTS
jgi:hypothetical protein